MQVQKLAGAVALTRETPRFTPAQWQRLFWDAGLRDCRVHLFLHDDSQPSSPWSMVVDTGRGLVDVKAYNVPLPVAQLEQACGREALLKVARSHHARVEIFAVVGRCPATAAHELVARVAAGILRTTFALAWYHPPSGILWPAGLCAEKVRELPNGKFPVGLYASVRVTNREPMVIVDTVGLTGFDLPELEIEVDVDDAASAESMVEALSAALALGERRLREGEPIEGALGLHWKGKLARSRLPPFRAVLRFEIAG